MECEQTSSPGRMRNLLTLILIVVRGIECAAQANATITIKKESQSVKKQLNDSYMNTIPLQHDDDKHGYFAFVIVTSCIILGLFIARRIYISYIVSKTWIGNRSILDIQELQLLPNSMESSCGSSEDDILFDVNMTRVP